MKILLHYAIGPARQRQLRALEAQGLQVESCAETDDACFYSLLPDTDVLWHVLRPISAPDIAKGKKLRLIQKLGVGVNTIDLEAARACGVAVSNTPGTNAQSVAEMALLLMLACLRRLPLLDQATREGCRLGVALQDVFGEIAGRTVGLIGYGSIPKILTPVLQALNAQVIYTATSPKPEASVTFRPLSDLLRESDIVSLHVPLTSATTRLIDYEQLDLMRRGAILINTARGGLVNQTALIAALQSGHLGSAGLDVFESEPIAPNNPLLKFTNVVVTPHVAWLTAGTLERSFGVAIENCRRLAVGDPLLHRVV